jgi:hypothetical protein
MLNRYDILQFKNKMPEEQMGMNASLLHDLLQGDSLKDALSLASFEKLSLLHKVLNNPLAPQYCPSKFSFSDRHRIESLRCIQPVSSLARDSDLVGHLPLGPFSASDPTITSRTAATQSAEIPQDDVADVLEQTLLTLLDRLRYDPERLKKLGRAISFLTAGTEHEESQLQTWAIPAATSSEVTSLKSTFETMDWSQDIGAASYQLQNPIGLPGAYTLPELNNEIISFDNSLSPG